MVRPQEKINIFHVASGQEAIRALAGGAQVAVHEHVVNPLVYQAARELIDRDDRGWKTDIQAVGYPHDVLEKMADDLRAVGVSAMTSHTILDALAGYAVGLGADFAREAQAKPLYARLVVTDRRPDDLPECDMTQATLLDGDRSVGQGLSQRVMESTIYGTRTSLTHEMDLDSMLASGRKKWVLIYFASPSGQDVGGLDSREVDFINLIDGRNGILPPAFVEEVKLALETGALPRPVMEEISEILQDVVAIQTYVRPHVRPHVLSHVLPVQNDMSSLLPPERDAVIRAITDILVRMPSTVMEPHPRNDMTVMPLLQPVISVVERVARDIGIPIKTVSPIVVTASAANEPVLSTPERPTRDSQAAHPVKPRLESHAVRPANRASVKPVVSKLSSSPKPAGGEPLSPRTESRTGDRTESRIEAKRPAETIKEPQNFERKKVEMGVFGTLPSRDTPTKLPERSERGGASKTEILHTLAIRGTEGAQPKERTDVKMRVKTPVNEPVKTRVETLGPARVFTRVLTRVPTRIPVSPPVPATPVVVSPVMIPVKAAPSSSAPVVKPISPKSVHQPVLQQVAPQVAPERITADVIRTPDNIVVARPPVDRTIPEKRIVSESSSPPIYVPPVGPVSPPVIPKEPPPVTVSGCPMGSKVCCCQKIFQRASEGEQGILQRGLGLVRERLGGALSSVFGKSSGGATGSSRADIDKIFGAAPT